MHAAGRVALGHFLVNDAAAGGHPLHVAGGDGAVVAHAVAVFDGSGENVGDGLDAAMRMPRESGEVVLGDVVAEVVEEQERIEILGVAEAERAAQMDSGAFERGLGLDKALDGSNGHVGLRYRSLFWKACDDPILSSRHLMREADCRTQTLAEASGLPGRFHGVWSTHVTGAIATFQHVGA